MLKFFILFIYFLHIYIFLFLALFLTPTNHVDRPAKGRCVHSVRRSDRSTEHLDVTEAAPALRVGRPAYVNSR